MADVALREDGAIARPLKAYVPLIEEQFDLAEKAGIKYYQAAGELLSEVREIHFERDAKGFFAWAEKNFGKKPDQIRTYVALVETVSDKSFKSLADFKRETNRGGYAQKPTSGYVHREWTAPVDAVADKARKEQARLAIEDGLSKRQEREAEAKLGLRLIDIGYKVLARELHPDKGGSRDAMTRLNRVRDRLRENV